MNKSFEHQVIRQIEAYNMIRPGEWVVAGVSGGKDSVCLLFVLDKLSQEWGFNLEVVHVNHMLRGSDSERDRRFVENLCCEMKIPCTAVDIDVAAIALNEKISTEEAGRKVRYETYKKAVKKIKSQNRDAVCKVALGHHMDDNVETILLNLSRGSSLNGITGMMPVSERNDLILIRPLLSISREEIENYVEGIGLPYVEDITNSSDDYARNKIRLNVIPELEKVNSRVSEHINDLAGRLIQIQEYMEKQVRFGVDSVVDIRDDNLSINVLKMKEFDPAIRTGIVHSCIAKMAGTMKDITHIHVNDVLSLMDKQTGRQIELPYGLIAARRYENIRISKASAYEAPHMRADYNTSPINMNLGGHVTISLKDIEQGGREFLLADGGRISFNIVPVIERNRAKLMEKNVYTKAFDCDTIKGTLILGRPEPDDEIKFIGGTKTLKKYFTDEKIPFEIRNQLLVLKDVNSVLWVLGYRIGEPYKITERTVRALVVSVIGGNDEQH